MPAVVDTDADGSFVVKFRGAGQGPRALVAEVLVALIAQALDLPVPRPAVVDLEDGFGRSEPDPEIQDVLRGSVGSNFGLEFLPGALAFDPAVDGGLLTPERAADIVWLDAFVTNVDRTPRNTNLLVSGRDVWLIDHGAALYGIGPDRGGFDGGRGGLELADSPAGERDHGGGDQKVNHPADRFSLRRKQKTHRRQKSRGC